MPTVTVGPDGGHDYASLNAAFAGEMGSLSEDLVIELHPMEDTTEADTGSSWTLNGHRIIVRTIGWEDELAGTWRTDIYRLVTESALGRSLRDRVGITIEGLQAQLTRTGSPGSARSVVRVDNRLAGASYDGLLLRVENNATPESLDTYGLEFDAEGGGAGDIRIRNVLVVGLGGSGPGRSGGVRETGSAGDIYLHHCGVVGTFTGERAGIDGSSIRARNCYVQGASGDDFGTVHADSDYNVSGDATAPGANSKTNETIAFRDSGSGDWRVDPEDTVVVDAGLDLTADTDNPVTHDIAGVQRPQGSAVDIGPFEIPADEDAPGTPGLTATSTSWDAVYLEVTAGADTDEINVYRSDEPGVTAADTLVATFDGTPPEGDAFDFSDTNGLLPATTYYYVAIASNQDGSASSGEQSATTFADDALEGLVHEAEIVIPFEIPAGEKVTHIDLDLGKVVRALEGLDKVVGITVTVEDDSEAQVGQEVFSDLDAVDQGTAVAVPLDPQPQGPQTITATCVASITDPA
jgi:hypothetical protein